MKFTLSLILVLWFFCTSFTAHTGTGTDAATCLSAEEKKLFDLINAYRKQNKLPEIALSKALTIVAQTHAKDLQDNYKNPMSNPCNMHSWSAKGKWSSCCYTPDHAKASCMWNKPRELTYYKDDGFEIAHYASDGATAQSSLNGWKTSKSGHNEVLLSKGIWKAQQWKAVGIGMRGPYAVAWFGRQADTAAAPGVCK